MATDIKDAIAYYVKCQYYNTKSFLAYGFQAAFFIIQNFISIAMTIITISVIYSISKGIAGWSYFQLLFLTNLTGLTFGLAVLLSNPNALPRVLREGRIDTYLTKPYGKLTLLAANSGAGSYLFSYILGGTMILAYIGIHLHITASELLSFALLYIFGVAALSMLLLLLGLLAYMLLKTGDFYDSLMRSLRSLSSYPLNIYGIPIQTVFSLLIPVGIATYYPAETLLGIIKPEYYAACLAIALFFIIVCYKSFNYLMRFYESGGG